VEGRDGKEKGKEKEESEIKFIFPTLRER